MKTVSIIIPIYNVERYIERCAISLFEQRGNDIEFIFVNDCTPDNTMERLNSVIEKYPEKKSQIKIINHEKNKGVGGARLTGIEAATGEYVWFIDSDDWIEPDSIDKCRSALQLNKDFIIIDYYVESSEGTNLCNIKDFCISNLLVNRIPPSLWKFLIKKSVLVKNNILPIEGLNFAEDFLMTSCLALISDNYSIIHEGLYHYNCLNPGSYMNNIKLSSLEGAAQSVSQTYDFYKRNRAEKKYVKALSYMLCIRYLELQKKDNNNKFLLDLEERIKETKTLLGYCILNTPKMSGIALKIYRHLIFISRDWNKLLPLIRRL